MPKDRGCSPSETCGVLWSPMAASLSPAEWVFLFLVLPPASWQTCRPQSTHITWLQGHQPGLPDVPAPEDESWWAFSPPWHSPEQLLGLNQGTGTKGFALSAKSCFAVSWTSLGLSPPTPFSSEAQASWPPEGQLSCPLGRRFPFPQGWASS